MKTAADLAIVLAREFDQSKSLYTLKQKMIDERWQENYFVSDYSISFNPVKSILSFKFSCPRLLARVQITREGGQQYMASLVEDGKIYDPQYEVVLRREKMIAGNIPYFAVSLTSVNEQKHLPVVQLLKQMKPSIYQKISEVIFNDTQELTLIVKTKLGATTVFLGREYWDEKMNKLSKIEDYFNQQTRQPKIINLTSNKKVVVRF